MNRSIKIGIIAGLKAVFGLFLLYGVVVLIFWLFQKQIGVTFNLNVFNDLRFGVIFPSFGLSYIIAKEISSRFGINESSRKLPASAWLSISIAVLFYTPFFIALISLGSILKHDLRAILQDFGFAEIFIFIVLQWLFSMLAAIKLFRGEDEGVI